MCILDGRKAARERRWPPPSYAGPRNVRVQTLHDPSTVGLWDSFFFYKGKLPEYMFI